MERRRPPPAALFLPLLALYVALVGLRTSDRFEGDEWRYVMYANNLLNGYYSPPGVVFLYNGPGYPLFLAPFAALGLPWGVARLANVAFLLGAVGYFQASARLFVSERAAFGAALALGIYPPLLVTAHLLLTESLVVFLLLGWAFHTLMAFRGSSAAHTVAAGVFIGCAALTKIVFGPALLAWAALSVGIAIFQRSTRALRVVGIAAIGFAICLPYLGYTHRLTGRTMYWGSASGMSFYFMSSPWPGETGDWYHQRQIRRIPALRAHHLATIDRIGRFDEVPPDSPLGELHFLSTDTADAEFKRIARENVRAHPLSFLRNWVANVSRLLFDAPFSYKIWPSQPLVYLVNLPFVGLAVYALVRAGRDRSRLTLGPAVVLLLPLITLGAYSVVSSVGRYSAPLLPLVALWVLSVLGAGSAGPTTSSIRRSRSSTEISKHSTLVGQDRR